VKRRAFIAVAILASAELKKVFSRFRTNILFQLEKNGNKGKLKVNTISTVNIILPSGALSAVISKKTFGLAMTS
jgi:hypothetical protein